jgi:hypothetical protein
MSGVRSAPLTVEKGGYIHFRGAEIGGGKGYGDLTAEINEDDLHITVISNFSDGNVKRLEIDYALSADETTVTFTKIEKYWNDAALLPQS